MQDRNRSGENHPSRKLKSEAQHQTPPREDANADRGSVAYREQPEGLYRISLSEMEHRLKHDNRANGMHSDSVVLRGPMTIHIHLGSNGRVSF
jgi:hypothetical protein